MAKKAVKKDKDLMKWKKKKWFSIHAPKLYSEAFLGETTVMSVENLKGKVIEASLMNLTGNMKRQNKYVKFRVLEVRENKAITEPVSYRIAPSSIKRIVRRKRDKVDDSFNAITKDKRVILIKPMFITRDNTYNSTLSSVRREARRLLWDYALNNDYETFFRLVTDEKIQYDVYKKLSKIYPIKMVEIKYVGIEKNPNKASRILKEFDTNPFQPREIKEEPQPVRRKPVRREASQDEDVMPMDEQQEEAVTTKPGQRPAQPQQQEED